MSRSRSTITTVTEGNSGTTDASFTVTLDQASASPMTVDFATADGTGPNEATAPGDYTPTSGTVTFAPGGDVAAVTVQVNADTAVEPTRGLRREPLERLGPVRSPTATAWDDRQRRDRGPAADGERRTRPDGQRRCSGDARRIGIVRSGGRDSHLQLDRPGGHHADRSDHGQPTFTAPDVAGPTPLTFTLEVCDEADPRRCAHTDTVVITVNPAAGGDTAADRGRRTRPDGHEGALVTLDGSGSSDPEARRSPTTGPPRRASR